MVRHHGPGVIALVELSLRSFTVEIAPNTTAAAITWIRLRLATSLQEAPDLQSS